MMFRALLVFLSAAVLAGCASTPKMERPSYLKVLAAKKIDPGTYARIAHGRVLGYNDIRELAQKGVPGKMIVPYLKATRTPYDFSTKQINGLVNAGADSTLINYLGSAKGIFLEDESNIPSGRGADFYKHPYWSDPYYMGPAPFAFGYPGMWTGDWPGFY